MPPQEEYMSNEVLVEKYLPQFGYQIHLASGEVEKHVNDEQSIRQFLRAIYGGRTPSGEVAFDPNKGLLVEKLPDIGESKLLYGKVSGSLKILSFQKYDNTRTLRVHALRSLSREQSIEVRSSSMQCSASSPG